MKNVLVKSDLAIITDFGCGTTVRRGLTRAYGGMTAIVPPEHRGLDGGEVEPRPSSDMYAYGLLVSQLIVAATGDPSECGRWKDLSKGYASKEKLVERAVEACDGVYSGLANIILDCIDVDPKKRPEAEAVVKILVNFREG